MTSHIETIQKSYQRNGVLHLVKRSFPYLYNHLVRPHLPRKELRYNGVAVEDGRLFDSRLPWRVPTHPSPPDYEAALIEGIREEVSQGDDVVVVGGGLGVSTVIAASETGQNGMVTTYEGSRDYVRKIRTTLIINEVPSSVDLVHGIVGEKVKLMGNQGDAEMISSEDLPNCDVLVLDCEGSEIEILESLAVNPRTIIVETHGHLNAPTSRVKDLLRETDYSVVSEKIAEVGPLKQDCLENDVYVLVARR